VREKESGTPASFRCKKKKGGNRKVSRSGFCTHKREKGERGHEYPKFLLSQGKGESKLVSLIWGGGKRGVQIRFEKDGKGGDREGIFSGKRGRRDKRCYVTGEKPPFSYSFSSRGGGTNNSFSKTLRKKGAASPPICKSGGGGGKTLQKREDVTG